MRDHDKGSTRCRGKGELRNMKKNKAIGVVVAIALFLGLLTYTTAVGFGPTGTGAAKNITLGLRPVRRCKYHV